MLFAECPLTGIVEMKTDIVSCARWLDTRTETASTYKYSNSAFTFFFSINFILVYCTYFIKTSFIVASTYFLILVTKRKNTTINLLISCTKSDLRCCRRFEMTFKNIISYKNTASINWVAKSISNSLESELLRLNRHCDARCGTIQIKDLKR